MSERHGAAIPQFLESGGAILAHAGEYAADHMRAIRSANGSEKHIRGRALVPHLGTVVELGPVASRGALQQQMMIARGDDRFTGLTHFVGPRLAHV